MFRLCLGIFLVQESGGSGFFSKTHDLNGQVQLARFTVPGMTDVLFSGP